MDRKSFIFSFFPSINWRQCLNPLADSVATISQLLTLEITLYAVGVPVSDRTSFDKFRGNWSNGSNVEMNQTL
jgi:hypothetical protein